MTMAFQTIRDALIDNILKPGAAALGTFQVVDYQQTIINDEKALDDLKLVEVFYRSGAFPLSGSVRKGPTRHNIEFGVNLLVSQFATADLTAFDNGTEAEKSAALLAMSKPGQRADRAMDQLWRDVYQTVMDVTKFDWGLARGVVLDRYIDRFRKDDPVRNGKHVILSASAVVSCHTQEELISEIPTVVATDYTGQIDNEGDDVAKTGAADDL